MNDMRPIPQNVADRPPQRAEVVFAAPRQAKTNGPSRTTASKVTERRRSKGKHSAKRNPPPKTCVAACRDCGRKQEAEKAEFYRASLPRCVACGGVLDSGEWFVKRIRGRY
jgi:hypothetical protein